MRLGGRFLVVVAILSALAAAAGAAPGPSAAAYFPLAEGTVWIYRTHAHGDVIMRVGPLARVGSRQCTIIETVVGGATTQRECYAIEGDGVYAYERSYPAGTLRLDPPQRVLAIPIAVGEAWEWTGRIGDQELTLKYTWARREQVKVPAGSYDAMQLYFEGLLPSNIHVQTWRWFAAGVGMVKEDSLIAQANQQTRVYAELLSVKIAK
jgi:hypothetical protein